MKILFAHFRNKTLSRLAILILTILMGLEFPLQVLAQEVSLDAGNNSTPESQMKVMPLPTLDPQLQALIKGDKILLAADNSQIPSAAIQKKMTLRQFYKKDFAISEEVDAIVDNANSENLTTEVYNSIGERMDFSVREVVYGQLRIFRVLPPSRITPGKYTLAIKDIQGNTYNQDFTWGVLAINTNKSIYQPGQTAQLTMAVLDERGDMVCDALLTLEIKSPDGNSTVLSTDNGKINVNSECSVKGITDKADYETSYQVGGIGEYSMNLTATTKNGNYSSADTFQVKDSVAFDVERITATRIYPAQKYTVRLHIKANQDFSGNISEVVPDSFKISDQSGLSSESQASSGAVFIDSKKDVLGVSTQKLGKPFEGDFQESLGFGQQIQDPALKQTYQNFSLAGHDGIDFSMPIGTPVLAIDDGTVTLAKDADYGLTVVIQHSWGKSYYGHLSKILTPLNSIVTRGQKIALSGNSGLTTGSHLHFGIKPNDSDTDNGYFGKVNPETYLDLSDQHINKAYAVKFLNWPMTIKKGQEVDLNYTYDAPDQSPQFYTLGPLSFHEEGNIVFQEMRVWQVAVDAVSTQFPTANEVVSTGWTNPNNGQADDGVYATAAPGKNGTFSTRWKTFGFDSIIPSGSTISNVTVNYQYKASTTASVGTMNMLANVSGVDQTNHADTSEPAADTTITTDITADRAWTRTDLLDANFKIYLGAQRGNSNTIVTFSLDFVSVQVTYTPPTPVLNLIHYRWRNDDGSETAATWRRAEDISATRIKNTNIRLRMEIANQGASTATSTTYKLEYHQKTSTCSEAGTWTALPTTATTEHFIIAPSANFLDGAVTTNVAGGLTDANTTFVAGQMKDTGNQTAGITLTNTNFTEIEFNIQATNNASDGNNYCFRLTNAGSTTDFTYTAYPEITVGDPILNQEHYRWRNDDGNEGNKTGIITYLSPTANGFSTNLSILAGCSGGSEWDCLNDNASNASSSITPPANDGATSALTGVSSGKTYVTLADNMIPDNSTITRLDVIVVANDTGNPNTNISGGYCITCDGLNDVTAATQAVNVTGYTSYTFSYTSLSLTLANLNNMQLLATTDGTRAAISAIYVKVTYNTIGATWKQSEDTAHTGQLVATNIRLRIEVANTGGIPANRNFRLEYAAKVGAICGDDESFTTLPTSTATEPFVMTTSYNFANSDATTAQLTATGTFSPGIMVQNPSNSSGTFASTNGNYSEFEYNFQARTGTTGSYCFRLTDNGTALDTYSVYPEIFIGNPGPTLGQLMRHGQWFNGSGAIQPFTF